MFTYIAGRFGDVDNDYKERKHVYEDWLASPPSQMANVKEKFLEGTLSDPDLLCLTPAFEPLRWLMTCLLHLLWDGYISCAIAKSKRAKKVHFFRAQCGRVDNLPADPYDYNTLGGLITPKALLTTERYTRPDSLDLVTSAHFYNRTDIELCLEFQDALGGLWVDS